MKRKVCFLAFVFMFLLFIESSVSVKSDNPVFEIVDFYSCDQSGFFRWCFEVNSILYLNLTVRNPTPNPKNVTISVTVYDDCSVPIGNENFDTTIPSYACKYYIVNFTIPPWAYVGEGKAYANVLEEGVPITSENATSFNISLECVFTNVTLHVQDLREDPMFAQVSVWHEARTVARGYTDDLGNFNTSLLSGGYIAKAWNENGWRSLFCSFNVPNTTYVVVILSPSVGGISIPLDRLSLLTPYVGLAMLLAVAIVTVAYVKKRKRKVSGFFLAFSSSFLPFNSLICLEVSFLNLKSLLTY